MKFKRSIVFCLLAFALIGGARAEISSDNLRTQFEQGRLSYEKYLEYSALNLYEPDKVPEQYRIVQPVRPHRSGTFLIQQLKENWDKISSESQRILAKYLQRRNNLPYEYVTPDKKFRIHYTLTGSDAVDNTDANRNNIPDYIEIMGENFQYIHHLLIDSLGYKPPAADSSGQGKEFDVYVVNLGVYYGITYLEQLVPGSDNRYSCYMEIENDFRGFPTDPVESIEVTSAHEYFHAVQVNYAYRDEDIFFMEMCSTWMEDYAHTQVNDYLNYLPSFFNHINYPFSYTNGSFEYASSLWNHMIVKKYGPTPIRKIWENIPAMNAMQAIRQVLFELGTSFEHELASFGLWNYFTGSRSDVEHFYPEGYLYPEVRPFVTDAMLDHHYFLESSMSKLSSNYYQISDLINNYSIGIIVTNLEVPQLDSYGNPDASEKDDLSFDIFMLPEDSLEVREFLAQNQLIKISQHHAARLNIREKEKWVAQSVVFRPDGSYQVKQFFPAVFSEENRNFIQNIFPNPFIVGNSEPLIISVYLHDQTEGELYIYSSDGRKMKSYQFDASNFYFTSFEWDGIDESGRQAGSGTYIAVLRVGSRTDLKKFAIIRK